MDVSRFQDSQSLILTACNDRTSHPIFSVPAPVLRFWKWVHVFVISHTYTAPFAHALIPQPIHSTRVCSCVFGIVHAYAFLESRTNMYPPRANVRGLSTCMNQSEGVFAERNHCPPCFLIKRGKACLYVNYPAGACRSVCPTVCLSVRLSIHLSVCPSDAWHRFFRFPGSCGIYRKHDKMVFASL